MNEIYETYYAYTAGTFYSPAQRSSLRDLLARVNGAEPGTEEYQRIEKTVGDVETLGLKTEVDCANWLFLKTVLPDNASEELTEAIVELSGALKRAPAYRSSAEWHRAMRESGEGRLTEAALYEYCSGNVADAIADLKQAARKEDLLAIECLARICADEQRYTESYFYLLKAENAYRKLHMPAKPWIGRFAAKMDGELLTEQQAQAVRAELFGKSAGCSKTQIGFTAHF